MRYAVSIALSCVLPPLLLAACAAGGSGPQATGGAGGTGAAGGTGGCQGGLVDCGDGCVDTAFDPQNCGACAEACPEDQVCSLGQCGVDCLGGTTKCGDVCVNLDSDPDHCGQCDAACPDEEVCAAGKCSLACVGGSTKCGSACVDTDLDPAHCGSCGHACKPAEVCAGGECGASCPDPLELCSGKCTSTSFDPQNCGKCGTVCPGKNNAVAACAQDLCGFFCKTGYGDCNSKSVDGCEIDLGASVGHCGSCDKVCQAMANSTAGCANGVCGIGQCNVGFGDCDKNVSNGCEADLKLDEQNCGTCGNVCPPASPFCDGGACAQPPTHGWQILDQKDIVYQSIGYLLLKVKYKSQSSASVNWCQDYLNLCQGYGYKPTGCGDQFMSGGYGWCKQQYLSDGVSNSLGCNASGGVASAAQQNGYNDANGQNSFAFHYCSDNDNNSCGNQMCQGTYCNNALSYCDYNQPFCYTLCKK